MRLPSPARGIRERSRSGWQRGFTLIEIMMVVGIMAIILAVGIPSFVQTFNKTPLRQGVEDITRGLASARERAILANHPTDFVLDIVGRTISISAATDVEKHTTGEAAPSGDESGSMAEFNAQLSEDLEIQLAAVNKFDVVGILDQVRVRFYPNGTSDRFDLVLRSLENEYRMITVEEVTGVAAVESDASKFGK